MKFKYLIIVLLLELLFIFIIDNSYALDEETINNISNNLDITLEKENDENILKNNIYNFIDLIDDSLIPTASFSMSSTLNENYDFLTIFAINFILNNEEFYKEDIVIGEDYIYNYGYGSYSTNKYIDINIIYDITKNIFGKDNYYIINDYLNIENNLVPLLLPDNYTFFMELDKIIDVVKFSNDYQVLLKYKDVDFVYKYIFEEKDNILFIKNIEIN